MLRSFVLAALLGVTSFGVAFSDETAAEFVPSGTSVDRNQKPIQDARITLHRWDGVMSPALETTTTDASGHFEFRSRRDDAYYYAVISKAPYAPASRTVGPEGPVKVTLQPAVDGCWIDVRSESGESLKGARIANISIRTEENTETYIWRGMEHLFGFEFGPSDDLGRLNLPSLPKGAVVDCRIDHPRWAQVKLRNVKVAEGRVAEAILKPGVMTTFQFVADSRAPLALDGQLCEVTLFSQASGSEESLNRIPMRIVGDRISFCAHPVTYESVGLKIPGAVITPVLERLILAKGAEPQLRFLVRKTVNVSGRVVHRDGKPHPGASVTGQTENLSPDGPVPGGKEWAYQARAETDANGRFTIALAPGKSRLEVDAEGFVADRDRIELDVRAGDPNEVPDFVVEPIPPVRGQVVDQNGRPVRGAIVRVRYPSLTWKQPALTDAAGRFEITLPWIPVDLDTQERRYEVDVAAFVADQPLAGVARIDLRNLESLSKTNIVVRPESSTDGLLSLEDNRWWLARKRKSISEGRAERRPAGEPGRPAPELDGVVWQNTEARSLKDFRGRYVLLDFWFTGCGPCHADFPSVKLIHERFEKYGVTVIGVHDNSSTPEAVREHCRKIELPFPIVVDHPDGRIIDAYRPIGVEGFPTYILIGPDGNIVENDHATEGPSLRTFKLEVIRKHVLDGRK